MHITAASAGGGTQDKLLDQLLPQVVDQLAGRQADLGVLFASVHFEDEMQRLTDRVRTATGVVTLIGCTAEAVIGPQREHEREPAISIWLGHLPGISVRSFHLSESEVENTTTASEWRDRLGLAESEDSSLVLLGDPHSVDIQTLLSQLNQHLPGMPLIGGMASGADAPGQAAVILNDESYREGAVGVSLSGALEVSTVVSQGCRPIGKPFVITKAERNIIFLLGGKKPYELLKQVYEEASPADQALMQNGVLIGRVINEHKDKFQRGDFLIRTLLGADEDTGAIAVGELMRAGVTVQFHVRDAATADEDLRTLLTSQAEPRPAGVLLFSCNGRGMRLFPERDHDVKVTSDLLNGPPIAGFFCAGELGPIGGKNFIHGHTASLAIFRPR
jgi:small ligand-binding sensory domain FIST